MVGAARVVIYSYLVLVVISASAAYMDAMRRFTSVLYPGLTAAAGFSFFLLPLAWLLAVYWTSRGAALADLSMIRRGVALALLGFAHLASLLPLVM